MAHLQVSDTNDYLLKDGKPFFYLADTAWMAFANLPLADWPRYLAYRKLQGFNALQMSILPVMHDTSISPDNIDPFLRGADGHWDFDALNPDYFRKAEQMVAMAVQEGFVPVLGVVWLTYVPGTGASERAAVRTAMPYESMLRYATYAANLFKQYDPIFFISGDTVFESPEEERYYLAALHAVKEVSPEALISMHLSPRAELPASFPELMDFYMYQSGHGHDTQANPYLLAETFISHPVKHPVVNAEPCYEGHGRTRGPQRTRFSAFDIRKATWQSLLSGAKMGVTYGGHGVWSFHRRGMRFLNAHRSFEPFNWDVALQLDGGWDVGFAKWVFETHNLFELNPTSVLLGEDPEIRASANADLTKIAVYCPYPFDVELDVDLTGYRVVAIDLASRRVTEPVVELGKPSRIQQNRSNADVLLLAESSGPARVG